MYGRFKKLLIAASVLSAFMTGCTRYTAMNNGRLSSLDSTPAFNEQAVDDNSYLVSYLADDPHVR